MQKKKNLLIKHIKMLTVVIHSVDVSVAVDELLHYALHSQPGC